MLSSIVAIAVLLWAFMKVQDSKNLRMERMTSNLDSLRKMRSGKLTTQPDYITSDGYSQDKLMWGGGKSGGREQ